MIELRDFVDEDVHNLFRWRREPEVDRWMYELPPEQFAAHEQWFDQLRADPRRRGWIIELNGQPCGALTLVGVSPTQRRAQWGWYIGAAAARGSRLRRVRPAQGLVGGARRSRDRPEGAGRRRLPPGGLPAPPRL